MGHKVLPAGFEADLVAVLVPGENSLGEVFYRLDNLCSYMGTGGDEKAEPCCFLDRKCNENVHY